MATHKQGNKETNNKQRPENEIKVKPKEFKQDKFSRIIQQLSNEKHTKAS